MNNKKLIKVLNTTKDTSEWYNISRKAINTYIRSGKLQKKDNLYIYKGKYKLDEDFYSSNNDYKHK